jgi:hypothetical protein
MLTKSMTMLSIVLTFLCINTAASTMQSSPILKLVASDGGGNKHADFPYTKPALAFQTDLIPLGTSNNNYFFQHPYPSTSTSACTVANPLIEGWVGRCLPTTRTAAALLTAKIGTTTNPLFSGLPGNVVVPDPTCNHYLQSDLNQNNKMNLFPQCVPTAQWRNYIASLNNNFGLAPYCNNVMGVNGQCQTSSSGTIATTISALGREVNQGENIIVQQRLNQQASCASGPGTTALSCVNSPISANTINDVSNGILTPYNNMPFLLPFP